MSILASAIVVHKGTILLLHRDNIPTIPGPDTWSFVGGHVEEGETPEMGLKREMQEEINVVPADIQFLGRRPWSDGGWSYSYVARLTDQEARNARLGNEGQEIRFFRFQELAPLPKLTSFKLFFETYPEILKKIIETGEAVSPEQLGLQPDGSR